MLMLTDTAARVLVEALTSRGEDPAKMLRVTFVDGEYTLTLDDPREEDQVIEHEGQGLLILDPEVSGALAEFTLDAQDTSDGPHLSLTKS